MKLVFKKGKYPKKYIAIVDSKEVPFGDIRYQHFKDRTPLKLYSKLDHLDENRRLSYYKRHNKMYPKYSADWFSKTYLW